MKICLIIHSLGFGGMERVMSLLANHFAIKTGVEVHLLLIGRHRVIEYDLSDLVHVHRPSFTFNNSKRVSHTFRTMRFIRESIKEMKPDAVLSFGEIWNNLVAMSLLGVDVDLYVSDRCKPDKPIGMLHDRLRKILYKRVKGIIAQTEYARLFFYALTGHQNIEVIGNPIKFIEETPGKRRKEILTVGRLISTKHHDRLIRLFIDLNLPNWKLVIVGGDALKQQNMGRLEKLVLDLGAEDKVLIEGEQKEIEKYYQRASIFAFTSSSEGFPNVIGEALSAGVPVVAYDCVSGPSDMIDDGVNGYLVDVFDDEFFKDRLLKLVNDEELRIKMGKTGKTSVQKYSPDKVGHKFFEFITSHL